MSNSSEILPGVLAYTKKWHGTIDDQFSNINSLVDTVKKHSTDWAMPEDLLSELNSNRNWLQTFINKCRSTSASTEDRAMRNTTLKSTVATCLTKVKTWAYGRYFAGVMTTDDVHFLGFLLPGEIGGHHQRTDPTDITAEVKIRIVNEDFIRVVIDQSAGENAAHVEHGWPNGVRNAVIVVTAADGKTEVIRYMTTRLHNDIQMPAGSHGKQFIVKAAFLRHIDDEPKFGNEPTFSMPLTTEDLAATLDKQHHDDYEEQVREVEKHRQEVERLHAEIDSAKKN
jgi:hypothetical protein